MCVFTCVKRGVDKGKCLCNPMSLSPLFSRDVSSDLKAEIINQGRATQANTHRVQSAVADMLLMLSRKRDSRT